MMSKNPLDLPLGRKLTRDEVAEALRLSIVAELDAVNLYLQLARAIDDEKIRKVFEDIAKEEKTHVGEFLALLKYLDPEQVQELKKGEEEVRELTGITTSSSNPNPGSNSNSANRDNGFEDTVAREVKRLVESARILAKKLPTVIIGRGVDAVPLERMGEKLDRTVLSLREISYKFRISQRAIDYAAKVGQPIEMPEAVNTALNFAAEEDRSIVGTLLSEGGVRIPLSSWSEPGTSVIDVARAIAELTKRGFRRPYILAVSLTRYTQLLSVSEKTGVTDLERVKMLVDDVIALHALPDDKVLVISATPEVLDVVYGGNAEVDYIGPEDGYHVFRLWSTIAVRLRSPAGVVVMETSIK